MVDQLLLRIIPIVHFRNYQPLLQVILSSIARNDFYLLILLLSVNLRLKRSTSLASLWFLSPCISSQELSPTSGRSKRVDSQGLQQKYAFN